MATEQIGSFEDLINLLERNPEYRARLRQLILDEEFQQLPSQVRTLIETVQSHAETLQSHTTLLQGILEQLESHGRMLESHGRMLESHGRMLESHGRTLARHERQLNRLLGDEVERRFQRNAAGFFGHLLRRIRVIDPSTLADEIDDAIDAGVLTEGDRRSLMAPGCGSARPGPEYPRGNQAGSRSVFRHRRAGHHARRRPRETAGKADWTTGQTRSRRLFNLRRQASIGRG